MSIDKIGFNNFKAFGKKMQIFEKKPITLIYGPNSIGKSSLLHSQLVLNNYKSVHESSINNKYFAGDELDIGDFKNYIHKHDDNRKINYQITLKEKKSIASFLDIDKHMSVDMIELYNNNFFDQEIIIEEIRTKLNSFSDNTLIEKVNDENWKKFIKLLNTNDSIKTYEKFYAYQYVRNIKEIRINLSFDKKGDAYIDFIDLDDTINSDEEASKIQNGLRNNILSRESFGIDNTLGCILKPAQYFGPLRPYPTRNDMFQFSTKRNKENYIDILKDSKYQEFFEKRNKYWKLLKKYNLKYLKFLDPKFIWVMYKSGAFNNLLSKNKKQVFSGSSTSHQLWMELINNEKLQNNISAWLSDKNKLKSTYNIRVDTKQVNYIDTIRLFGKSKINSESKGLFEKSIKSLDNLFEKTLAKLFNRKPSYLNELKFIDTRTDTEVTPRDMGLGISQILPILLSTFSSKEKALYLEQPELHLHPAIQMEIMDEFIRSAKERNNDFMIETHSEHLLLRIMRRMRDTSSDKFDRDKSLDLTPDDICLLYVDSDGDTTYVRELRLSPKGKLLDHWPNGFFEEGFKERFK